MDVATAFVDRKSMGWCPTSELHLQEAENEVFPVPPSPFDTSLIS